MKIAEIGLHYMSLLTLQAIQSSKESVIFATFKIALRARIWNEHQLLQRNYLFSSENSLYLNQLAFNKLCFSVLGMLMLARLILVSVNLLFSRKSKKAWELKKIRLQEKLSMQEWEERSIW